MGSMLHVTESSEARFVKYYRRMQVSVTCVGLQSDIVLFRRQHLVHGCGPIVRHELQLKLGHLSSFLQQLKRSEPCRHAFLIHHDYNHLYSEPIGRVLCARTVGVLSGECHHCSCVLGVLLEVDLMRSQVRHFTHLVVSPAHQLLNSPSLCRATVGPHQLLAFHVPLPRLCQPAHTL